MRICISIKDKDKVALKALEDIIKKVELEGISLSFYIRTLIVKDIHGNTKSS